MNKKTALQLPTTEEIKEILRGKGAHSTHMVGTVSVFIAYCNILQTCALSRMLVKCYIG